MWYGTVTESVNKETVFYLMECPITSIVFQINMAWRNVVGISLIFLWTGFYFWSVSGFQVKKLHKGTRDPWVKYRQRHEKLWQLTNTVNFKHHSSHVKWVCDSGRAPWKWVWIWKVELKTASYFIFMGFVQYMTSLYLKPTYYCFYSPFWKIPKLLFCGFYNKNLTHLQ